MGKLSIFGNIALSLLLAGSTAFGVVTSNKLTKTNLENEDLKQTNITITEENTNLKTSLAEYLAEQKTLQDALNLANTRLAEVESELATSNANIETLTGEKQELESTINAQQLSISKLQSSITSATHRIQELETNLQIKQTELETLQASNNASQEEISNLILEIESLENEKINLESELAITKGNLQTAENQLNEKQIELERLNIALANANAENENLNTEIVGLNIQITTLNTTIDELNAEIERLNGKISELDQIEILAVGTQYDESLTGRFLYRDNIIVTAVSPDAIDECLNAYSYDLQMNEYSFCFPCLSECSSCRHLDYSIPSDYCWSGAWHSVFIDYLSSYEDNGTIMYTYRLQTFLDAAFFHILDDLSYEVGKYYNISQFSGDTLNALVYDVIGKCISNEIVNNKQTVILEFDLRYDKELDDYHTLPNGSFKAYFIFELENNSIQVTLRMPNGLDADGNVLYEDKILGIINVSNF